MTEKLYNLGIKLGKVVLALAIAAGGTKLIAMLFDFLAINSLYIAGFWLILAALLPFVALIGIACYIASLVF